MKNGCRLLGYNNTCIKYDCNCTGSKDFKQECPEWGVTIATEEYYAKKLNTK